MRAVLQLSHVPPKGVFMKFTSLALLIGLVSTGALANPPGTTLQSKCKDAQGNSLEIYAEGSGLKGQLILTNVSYSLNCVPLGFGSMVNCQDEARNFNITQSNDVMTRRPKATVENHSGQTLTAMKCNSFI